MMTIEANGAVLHVDSRGPEAAPVLMFSNSLGTDLRVWDPLLEVLPQGYRIIRYDKRGHGLSDCPPGPYTLDQLVDDGEAVAAHFDLSDIHFVGLSIGGLTGQGLAARRPDLLRSLTLMDTAARIGTPEMWADRIADVRAQGLPGMADGILDRWFAPALRNDAKALAPWRNMLARTPLEGYLACCAAIAGADYTGSTAGLTLPVMAMAGSHDGSTPPEVVEATAQLCKGRFHLIEDAGHLPCVEQPEVVARLITDFVEEFAA